ncbi:MAG: acyl-CoA thioesterase [Waddliaceae bacterium]|nr:acyl-CoA thioesterase [Waddliaceae bacterium]
MPQHANPLKTLFGGVLVSWIDQVAGMVAVRYGASPAVTASIDHIDFQKPIYVGDILILKASVNYVGRTSMEVGVAVSIENPYSGDEYQATKAFLTFVSLDENRQPRPVPRLLPETEEEKRRYRHAQMRAEARRELRQKMSNGELA